MKKIFLFFCFLVFGLNSVNAEWLDSGFSCNINNYKTVTDKNINNGFITSLDSYINKALGGSGLQDTLYFKLYDGLSGNEIYSRAESLNAGGTANYVYENHINLQNGKFIVLLDGGSVFYRWVYIDTKTDYINSFSTQYEDDKKIGLRFINDVPHFWDYGDATGFNLINGSTLYDPSINEGGDLFDFDNFLIGNELYYEWNYINGIIIVKDLGNNVYIFGLSEITGLMVLVGDFVSDLSTGTGIWINDFEYSDGNLTMAISFLGDSTYSLAINIQNDPIVFDTTRTEEGVFLAGGANQELYMVGTQGVVQDVSYNRGLIQLGISELNDGNIYPLYCSESSGSWLYQGDQAEIVILADDGTFFPEAEIPPDSPDGIIGSILGAIGGFITGFFDSILGVFGLSLSEIGGWFADIYTRIIEFINSANDLPTDDVGSLTMEFLFPSSYASYDGSALIDSLNNIDKGPDNITSKVHGLAKGIAYIFFAIIGITIFYVILKNKKG